jgi:homospermidine synthase
VRVNVLSDYFAEADCGIAFLAFGTRKTRMQPRSQWIAWRKAGYDAFLIKDAHKSEIQLHWATFEKFNMQNSRCDSLESKQCLQLVTPSTHYLVRRALPTGGPYAEVTIAKDRAIQI